MAADDLIDWMERFNSPTFLWFAKRLTANDTLASGSNQAGPYIPKKLMFRLFPQINVPGVKNPDCSLPVQIDPLQERRAIRAVWYNGKLHGGTRDETRLTQFGGRRSPLLDPENTGALALFVFALDEDGASTGCSVWVCGGGGREADLVEGILGPVEPKASITWQPGTEPVIAELYDSGIQSPCRLAAADIPEKWLTKLPSGRELVGLTIDKRPRGRGGADARLLSRRNCELEIFKSIRDAHWLPKINRQYQSTDDFTTVANSLLQSQKSRAGNSLEYHADAIFREEGFRSGIDFVHKPKLRSGRKPDFIFPSLSLYEEGQVPPQYLTFLAAKTTLKDRWRQILNEDRRMAVKHLLTLQSGVSEQQFDEIQESGVKLVVPASLHRGYPKEVRPHLMTLGQFLKEVRAKQKLLREEYDGDR